MNKLKYLLMVMLAVLAFTACEDKDDENKEPKFTDYFSMQVTKCVRVGANLKVDFNLKNISGKDLQGVMLNGGGSDRCKDDLGSEYYSSVSLQGGDWKTSVETNLAKGASVSGSFLVENYDLTNSSKKFNLIFNGRCQTVSFDGRAEVNNIKVVDNRILKNGFDTNDQILEYKVVSCKMVQEDGGLDGMVNRVYLTYQVKNTSSKDIPDFLQNFGGHDQVKDNTNEEYNADIAIEGGEFRASQKVTLKAGETKTFVVKVFSVRENATALSGYVSTASGIYPWADTKARFYDISITK